MPSGKVKWFNKHLGYGFLRGPDGDDVFFHYSDIEGKGRRYLKRNDFVSYQSEDTAEGSRAKNIKKA